MTDQDFEERLSALLTGGSDQPLAAGAIIAGARRRRTRRRAAAASSLALLGVAVGAVAISGPVPGRATGPGTVATVTPSLGPRTVAPVAPKPHQRGTPGGVLDLLAPETAVGSGTLGDSYWEVLAASVPDEAAFEAAHPDVFHVGLGADHKPAVWAFLLVDGEIESSSESPAPAAVPYAFIPAFARVSVDGKNLGDAAFGWVDPRADHYQVDYAAGPSKTVRAVLVGDNHLIALADTPADPAVKVTAYDAAGKVLDSREGVTLMP